MKNVQTKSLLVICIALAFLLFRECQSNKTISANDITTSIAPVTNLITKQQADAYEEAYIKKYNDLPKVIAANGGKMPVDVRDVWFDIAVMESYINYVKTESKKLGYDGLGIRVYLGAKDLNGSIKNTIFFAPTHKTSKNDGLINNFTAVKTSNKNTYAIKPLNYGSAGMPPNPY